MQPGFKSRPSLNGLIRSSGPQVQPVYAITYAVPPVSISTGTVSFCRSWRRTSNPFRPGSMTSSTIASYCPPTALESASRLFEGSHRRHSLPRAETARGRRKGPAHPRPREPSCETLLLENNLHDPPEDRMKELCCDMGMAHDILAMPQKQPPWTAFLQQLYRLSVLASVPG